MFYSDTMDQKFRFGDVIKGFATTTPIIDNPPLDASRLSFQIEVTQSGFYVVLSPCCSINENVVVLCPLIELRSTFFKNSYLEEDMTRINKPMRPEQAIPPNLWEQFSEQERQKRLAVGMNYAFVELFVYAKHQLFPEYVLSIRRDQKRTTQEYMVDFRQSFIVRCAKITNNSTPFENVKELQLSIDARGDLRNKLAAYFSRVPEEDKVMAE
jgi:hypothetical protein